MSRSKRVLINTAIDEIIVQDNDTEDINKIVHDYAGKQLGKMLRGVSTIETKRIEREGAVAYTVKTVLLHPAEFERLKLIEAEFIRQLKEEQEEDYYD